MIQSRIAIPLATLALGLAAGLTLGWKLYRTKPVQEAPAPQIRQQDGSLVLERKPEAKPEPKHELPKGAKLERQVGLDVIPKPPAIPTADHAIPTSGTLKPVEPIHIDLSLVKMPDGTRRVIASSPNAEVVGGIDIPVEPEKPVKQFHWQAGALWNPSESTYGAFVTRTAGPFVVGAQLYQQRIPIQAGGGTKVEGMIAVGIQF